MARTLYLNDGSTEIVIGDQEEVLGRIIEERLGRDCKELFDDIKEESAAMRDRKTPKLQTLCLPG